MTRDEARERIPEMMGDIVEAALDPTPRQDGTCPEDDLIDSGLTVMSNLGHKIDADAERLLRNGKHHGDYAAWEFHGTVWFDLVTEEWCCDVRRYRQFKECVRRATLREIMDYCCEKYGDE